MEGSSQGAIQSLKALQGATRQDPCLRGEGDASASWEQHLSPGSLSSENLEGLTEKDGTLGLWAAKKNEFGAAKKQARTAKMAEALARDSAAASLGHFKAAKSRLCRSSVHLGPRAKRRRR
jgi:hypothetical protein